MERGKDRSGRSSLMMPGDLRQSAPQRWTVAKRLVTKERIQAGKESLERIVSALTRLVQLYESEKKVMEDSEGYEL